MPLTLEHAPAEDSLMLDSEVDSQNLEDGVLPQTMGRKVSRSVALSIVAMVALFGVAIFGQQRGLSKGAVSNDVELAESSSWCYKEHQSSNSVGMNFRTSKKTDAKKCQEECTEDDECTAIVFASDRHHGGSGPKPAYAHGACMIKHSSVKVAPASVRFLNLDLYVKEKCKDPEPKAAADLEPKADATPCTFDASRGHCHQEWLNHKNNGHPDHVPAPFCNRCVAEVAFGQECSACCSVCQAGTD